jgi:hypothetical protein
VVSREVLVADTISTELLGPGDVVRPWTVQESPEFLQLEIRWTALTESRIAVMDRRFGTRLSAWPEVNAALIDRVNARAQRLATTQAISQLVRVDRRLLALFWHLAERWGRVTSDGVVVPLTLSHRMLSQLVGARRPTVSTAIGTLTERGELIRREDGTWLVKGEPVGLPHGGTGRAVPARRRFLKPAGDPEPVALVEVPPPAEPEATHPVTETALARVMTARAELRETLERMRAESQLRLDALKTVAEENERVLRLVTEGRARRQSERDEMARDRRDIRSQPA